MTKKSSPDESKYRAKLREPEFVMADPAIVGGCGRKCDADGVGSVQSVLKTRIGFVVSGAHRSASRPGNEYGQFRTIPATDLHPRPPKHRRQPSPQVRQIAALGLRVAGENQCDAAAPCGKDVMVLHLAGDKAVAGLGNGSVKQ